MSIMGRHVPTGAAAIVALLLIAAAIAPVLTSANAREIRLVARGMAFYADGDLVTPNPTIDVKAGERVRIVLVNQDRGMTHDFALPSVSAAMDAIDWNEQNDLVFDVPDEPGTYQYVCRPHQLMMKGTLRVTQ
jgi:plastocyanin